MPKVIPGYAVSEYASGLDNPRLIRTAPNGDLFVAESNPGRVKVMRGRGADGTAQTVSTFATGPEPAVRDRVLSRSGRTPSGSTSATPTRSSASPTRPATSSRAARRKRSSRACPAAASSRGGGHWTRDVAFSPDGKKMYVGVGSLTNVDDPDVNANEKDRATILEFNPDGTGAASTPPASATRSASRSTRQTGKLWVSVNERDDLGDNLVPDYITHVEDGGFYGWPWYYMGGTQDPRHAGKHPELKDKVITPDVLLQPHSASLSARLPRAAAPSPRSTARGTATCAPATSDPRAVQQGRHGHRVDTRTS